MKFSTKHSPNSGIGLRRFGKSYTYSTTNFPLPDTWGIQGGFFEDYQLSGFDENGTAKTLTLTVNVTTWAKGIFQHLVANSELILQFKIDEKTGIVLTNGEFGDTTPLRAWTIGQVFSSATISSESVGRFTEQMWIDYSLRYINQDNSRDQKLRYSLPFTKKQTTIKE